MECPECGKTSRSEYRYCPFCGANLEDRKQVFDHTKKAAKKDFSEYARKEIGGLGFSKLANAAWCISANTKENFEYLQGEKMGEKRSYSLLEEAKERAKEILRLLNCVRETYNRGIPVTIAHLGDKRFFMIPVWEDETK